MKQGLPFWGCALVLILMFGLLPGCDEGSTGDQPQAYIPIVEVLELTPSLDAGAPVVLDSQDDQMAILYSGLFEGTGDIYRLILSDDDADGLFESFELLGRGTVVARLRAAWPSELPSQ